MCTIRSIIPASQYNDYSISVTVSASVSQYNEGNFLCKHSVTSLPVPSQCRPEGLRVIARVLFPRRGSVYNYFWSIERESGCYEKWESLIEPTNFKKAKVGAATAPLLPGDFIEIRLFQCCDYYFPSVHFRCGGIYF